MFIVLEILSSAHPLGVRAEKYHRLKPGGVNA
jgi:hypothetical protein